MSLENLKNNWEAINSTSLEKPFSNEQIETMLSSKYRFFMNKVLIFETLKLWVYLYFIALIIYRYDTLQILYLKALGIIAITMLAALFILRIQKLVKTYRSKFLNELHITAFEKIASRTLKLQRFYLINILFGFLLAIILIVLTIRFYNEYDLTQSRLFWVIVIPITFTFVFLLNRWVHTSYSRIVQEAEGLLQNLK